MACLAKIYKIILMIETGHPTRSAIERDNMMDLEFFINPLSFMAVVTVMSLGKFACLLPTMIAIER